MLTIRWPEVWIEGQRRRRPQPLEESANGLTITTLSATAANRDPYPRFWAIQAPTTRQISPYEKVRCEVVFGTTHAMSLIGNARVSTTEGPLPRTFAKVTSSTSTVSAAGRVSSSPSSRSSTSASSSGPKPASRARSRARTRVQSPQTAFHARDRASHQSLGTARGLGPPLRGRILKDRRAP